MSRRLPTFKEALLDLKRLLIAIEPYLGEVVLGGGWAPFFYRYLPDVSSPAHPALVTFDFDVVVPPALPTDPSGTLPELLKDGQFVPLTAIDPPVVIYQHDSWGEITKAPVYAEVLTPLRGSILDRSGQPKHVKKVQDGLTAQQLRYLDLLLHEPIDVDVGRIEVLEIDGALKVRIPNPAAYVLQKALIHGERGVSSQRKDLAYIYDIAVMWFRQVERVRRMMESLAAGSPEWGKWYIKGREVLLWLFRQVDADGPVAVEREFADRPEGPPVSAAAAFRVVEPFLKAALPESP